MSDIQLDGIVVFLASFLVICAGGIAAVVALLAAVLSAPSPWESRSQRVRRYLAGPVTCLGVGLPFLGSHDDNLAALPLGGLVLGIVVQLIGARRNERHRNAWLTEDKQIEPG